jgi:hypothetical protein
MTAAATILELNLGEMRQLFNSMDPAPFRERDIDPRACDYIVGWASEEPKHATLGLRVRLAQERVTGENASVLADAVHTYFAQRAQATRRQLRQLFRTGRVSLLIGLAFLACAIAVGEVVAGWASRESYGSIIKESFVIGGWVALWRPLEIFLYDWWPILSEARLYDRLSTMDVSVVAPPAAGVAS